MTRTTAVSPRAQLAHSALSWLGDSGQLDVMHIKGGATDPDLLFRNRTSEDADVLVRPAHVASFLQLMEMHGWRPLDSFSLSSPFAHSMSFGHPTWGVADVHRLYPGLGLAPERAFEVLWSGRTLARIGGQPCWVPSRPGQALLLLLHAARSPRAWRSRQDVAAVWDAATPDFRALVRSLAGQLDAELALAIALGEDLTGFRGRRDYRLWEVVSHGGTRLDEWRARLEAEATVQQKLRLAARMLVVNPYALASRLGRAPTRWELLRYSARRLAFGVRDQFHWGASGRTQIVNPPATIGPDGQPLTAGPVERPIPRRKRS